MAGLEPAPALTGEALYLSGRTKGSDDGVEDDLPQAIPEPGDNDHAVVSGAASAGYRQGIADGRRRGREGAADGRAVRFGAGGVELGQLSRARRPFSGSLDHDPHGHQRRADSEQRVYLNG